ncbi:uncharacterized protein LOC116949219 isoform X2 [Petromyzon marinus]
MTLKTAYTVGYSSSLTSLALAMLILCLFRKLRCTRNYIHMHLFASFMLRAISVFIKDRVLFTGEAIDNCAPAPATCKVVMVFFQYCIMANFSWLLVEGLYLHTLLLVSFFSERKYFYSYIIIGWGTPAVFVVVWTVCRVVYEDTGCWDNKGNLVLWWIIKGPILLSILTPGQVDAAADPAVRSPLHRVRLLPGRGERAGDARASLLRAGARVIPGVCGRDPLLLPQWRGTGRAAAQVAALARAALPGARWARAPPPSAAAPPAATLLLHDEQRREQRRPHHPHVPAAQVQPRRVPGLQLARRVHHHLRRGVHRHLRRGVHRHLRRGVHRHLRRGVHHHLRRGVHHHLRRGVHRHLRRGVHRHLRRGVHHHLRQGVHRHLRRGVHHHLRRGVHHHLRQGVHRHLRRGVHHHLRRGVHRHLRRGVHHHLRQGVHRHLRRGVHHHLRRGVHHHLRQGVHRHLRRGVHHHLRRGVHRHLRRGVHHHLRRGVDHHFQFSVYLFWHSPVSHWALESGATTTNKNTNKKNILK